MKVAYVTTYDAADVHHWSGLGFFLKDALTRNGFDLSLIGPLRIDALSMLILRTKGLWYNRIWGRRFFRSHDGRVARRFGRVVDRRLAALPEVELIFSPGVIPVAYVEDRRPLAVWSDATHARLFDYYAEYTGLCRANLRDGHRTEYRALSRCAAAIFASDWAAASARDDYGVPQNRVHVIPFGANLTSAPTEEMVRGFVASRPRDECRLLFIGVDWERKGGPLAVEVTDMLRKDGVRATLTIMGCNPYRKRPAPEFVTIEGFVSKETEEGRAKIRAHLENHHFLIVPSRAECYGLVYCEANAFAMPCLACRTGGVPTIIHEGENGHLFEVARPARAYADAIRKLFSDYDRYLDMCRRARRHFSERLNWDVSARRATEVLREAGKSNPLAAS